MKYILIFISVLAFNSLFSQKKYSRKQFRIDSLKIVRPRLVRPQVRLDNKTLFYQGEVYNINGFDFGAIIKEKIRLTLGYYYLNDFLNDHVRSNNTFDRHLNLKYGSLNAEFIYLNTRFFTLGIPFEFGFGGNTLRYKIDLADENYQTTSGFVSSLDVGLSGTFKPIRWINVRLVAGYRKTLINQVDDLKFEGALLSFGIGVNIREVSKDIRMFALKKKYKRLGNPLDTAVDLITD